MSAPNQNSRGWLFPVITVALLVLGTIAVTVAIVLAIIADDEPSSASPAAEISPTSTTQPGALASDPSSPGDDGSASYSPSDSSTSAERGSGSGDAAGSSSQSGTAGSEIAISQLPDQAWVERVAQEAQIPQRALSAYAGASLAVADTYPDCKIGWNTLAAIGLVESEHASMGGAVLGDDGVATPKIIGVALNGDGVAKIADTDQGALDGDKQWDRAVGPMQFLPATWEQYAQDGNADGNADVHNIDDASLAAAEYLCEVGGDLRNSDNWIKAIAAYNAGREYNAKIADAATRYSSFG